MRKKLNFSLSAMLLLAVTLAGIIGCLDATEKDIQLEEDFRNRMNKRVIVSAENFQHDPYKTSWIKDELLKNVKNKSTWDSAFATMKVDEEISDRKLKADSVCLKSDLRLIALTKISNMGTQTFEVLLESGKLAENDFELEHVLDVLTSALLKNNADASHHAQISTFLRRIVREKSGDVHAKALKILSEIASESDFVILARNLDIDDGITRMLIYKKLRNTSSNKVIIEIAKHLEAQKMVVRVYAVNLLRQLTGEYFGYNPGGELISRQIQAVRWQTYIQNYNKFRNTVLR